MNTKEIIAVTIVSTVITIILNKIGVVDAVYKLLGGTSNG